MMDASRRYCDGKKREKKRSRASALAELGDDGNEKEPAKARETSFVGAHHYSLDNVLTFCTNVQREPGRCSIKLKVKARTCLHTCFHTQCVHI